MCNKRMNSNIKSSSCFDYQAFFNSEVSLIIRGAIKAKMCFIFGHKFCLSPR